MKKFIFGIEKEDIRLTDPDYIRKMMHCKFQDVVFGEDTGGAWFIAFKLGLIFWIVAGLGFLCLLKVFDPINETTVEWVTVGHYFCMIITVFTGLIGLLIALPVALGLPIMVIRVPIMTIHFFVRYDFYKEQIKKEQIAALEKQRTGPVGCREARAADVRRRKAACKSE